VSSQVYVSNWPQQPIDDLRVDLAYQEKYASQSLNSKFAGILPEGVYRGFDVSVDTDGGAFAVKVGSAGDNVALMEVYDPTKPAIKPALTARMPKGLYKKFSIAKGATNYVVLNVFYKVSDVLDVSEQTTTSISVVSSLVALPAHTGRVVLATINIDSGAGSIQASDIVLARKIDLGTNQISESFGLPDGALDSTYTIAYGSGALMGRFTLLESVTGGALEFTAVHSDTGKARINLVSVSDDFPAKALRIGVTAGGSVELRIDLNYTGSADSKFFVEYQAFDSHNDSQVGWVKAFAPAAGGYATEKALIKFGDVAMGSTGEIAEKNQPLKERYLGIESEAKTAKSSTTSGLATKAKTAAALNGMPANNFPASLIDPNDSDLAADLAAGGNELVPESTDPDTVTAPIAVLSSTGKLPTSGDRYRVKTFSYGSLGSAVLMRIQEATLLDGTNATTVEAAPHKSYRWLKGMPANAATFKKSDWKSTTEKGDFEKEAASLLAGLPWAGSGPGDIDGVAFIEQLSAADIEAGKTAARRTIDTEEFIELLDSMGAFVNGHWVNRGSWSYGGNDTLNMGSYSVDLAGCLVEVYGSKANHTLTVTTPTTNSAADDHTLNSQFIRVDNGSTYNPGWRRILTEGAGTHQVRNNTDLDTRYAPNRSATAALSGQMSKAHFSKVAGLPSDVASTELAKDTAPGLMAAALFEKLTDLPDFDTLALMLGGIVTVDKSHNLIPTTDRSFLWTQIKFPVLKMQVLVGRYYDSKSNYNSVQTINFAAHPFASTGYSCFLNHRHSYVGNQETWSIFPSTTTAAQIALGGSYANYVDILIIGDIAA